MTKFYEYPKKKIYIPYGRLVPVWRCVCACVHGPTSGQISRRTDRETGEGDVRTAQAGAKSIYKQTQHLRNITCTKDISPLHPEVISRLLLLLLLLLLLPGARTLLCILIVDACVGGCLRVSVRARRWGGDVNNMSMINEGLRRV